jgi:arylformamidase
MPSFNIDLDKYRIVDLSWELVPGASAIRNFDLRRDLLPDDCFYYHVNTHTHVGSHVEVAAHYFEGGQQVTDYPVTAFMGRALLLEVRDVEETPDVTPEYLEQELDSLIKGGDIIICRNSDVESWAGRRLQPAITPAAAQWLADHKVKMLGIDSAPNPDGEATFLLGRGKEKGRQVHDIFLSAGGTFVEFLMNLDQIDRKEFFFMALPFKAKGIDSSWCRAIAILEK